MLIHAILCVLVYCLPHRTLPQMPRNSRLFPRSETYQYYTEPFCAPPLGKEYKAEGLGEVLEGDRLVRATHKVYRCCWCRCCCSIVVPRSGGSAPSFWGL